MRNLLLLFLLPTILAISQTINFDDASKWTQGSGPLNTYQDNHKYTDQINGYDVEFTGVLARREEVGTFDGQGTTYNNSQFSWRLKQPSTTNEIPNFTAIVNATQIDGFSFYMRREDGTPPPICVVEVFNPSTGSVLDTVLIAANFFDRDSEWKLYTNNGSESVPESVGQIGIRLTLKGVVKPVDGVFIDDFSFDNPLPVELTTFAALTAGNNVELNWETATEVNNYGFNVERKTETGDWNKVGFVDGHGNSNSLKQYKFEDNTLETSGKYFYRLKQVDIDGTFEYSEEVEIDIELNFPTEFGLGQNFPNPFNPTTTISFSVPLIEKGDVSPVRLTVFNIIGEQVAELVNSKLAAGHHEVQFDADELNSGIYIYKLEVDNHLLVRKMMLLK